MCWSSPKWDPYRSMIRLPVRLEKARALPLERDQVSEQDVEVAVLGGGCFWCVEAVFNEIDAVSAATSGYSGGHTVNPNYYQVCSEKTGHAEVVRLEFDPDRITFPEILEVFFATHDPTTLNRQGRRPGSTVSLGDPIHLRGPEGTGGEFHRGAGHVGDRERTRW